MTSKKKVFATLATAAVGSIAAAGLMLSPTKAFADEHAGEGKCSHGDKKHDAGCNKGAAAGHKEGDSSCKKADGSCSKKAEGEEHKKDGDGKCGKAGDGACSGKTK